MIPRVQTSQEIIRKLAEFYARSQATANDEGAELFLCGAGALAPAKPKMIQRFSKEAGPLTPAARPSHNISATQPQLVGKFNARPHSTRAESRTRSTPPGTVAPQRHLLLHFPPQLLGEFFHFFQVFG